MNTSNHLHLYHNLQSIDFHNQKQRYHYTEQMDCYFFHIFIKDFILKTKKQYLCNKELYS